MKEILSYKIGIIGYGNFGKVISQYLFPKNKLFIYSSRREQTSLFPTNNYVTFTSSIYELVEASDIIIPAGPIRQFEQVVREISEFVKPNHLVMDICSVKEYPVNILRKYLIEKAQIVATHPMFGPVSIERNNGQLSNLNFVLYNLQCNDEIYDEIKNYFKNLNLNIVEIDPAEHDKLAAQSHFFSKIVKHVAFMLNLQQTIIDTPTAAAIFDGLNQTSEDKTIVEDMIMYNKYCKEILEKTIETLEELR